MTRDRYETREFILNLLALLAAIAAIAGAMSFWHTFGGVLT